MRYRKNRLIPDSFQYRFLIVSVLHYLAIILIFVAALFVPLMVQLDSMELSASQRGELASQFLSLHERVWPAVVVVLVLLGLHIVFFSHRVAGPLYRWRGMFKKIGEGDLTVRATLRKHDYLHAEGEALNEMLLALHTKIQDIGAHRARLGRIAEELVRTRGKGSAEGVEQLLQQLDGELKSLSKTLEQFKTAS